MKQLIIIFAVVMLFAPIGVNAFIETHMNQTQVAELYAKMQLADAQAHEQDQALMHYYDEVYSQQMKEINSFNFDPSSPDNFWQANYIWIITIAVFVIIGVAVVAWVSFGSESEPEEKKILNKPYTYLDYVKEQEEVHRILK